MQYLFLNRRHIRDRSLQHALSEAYRGLLMTGRYPVVFLQLEMEPEGVDVNVHPAKLEVRFQDGGRIYSHVLATIRNRFLTTDLTARSGRAEDAGPAESSTSPASARSPAAIAHAAVEPREQWARQNLRDSFALHSPRAEHQSRLQLEPDRQPPPGGGAFGQAKPAAADTGNPGASFGAVDEALDQPWQPRLSESDSAPSADTPTRTHSALQVHNRYLVTQNDEGLLIIDQHALHERILYERLREKVLQGKLETQRMLVPEPVSLMASESATVLSHRETLEAIGILIEPFGGDSVLVSGYPAMLAQPNVADMLRGIVDLLLNEGKQPERRDVIDSLLHMISCKAAIKAGDKLTGEEIEELLRDRDLCQDAHHCPHGRPTALVFSRQELDKQFKRI